MENRLQNLFERLEKLLEEDLSHDETFGLQNGFHEVNEIKNEVTNHLLSILRDLEVVIGELPAGLIEREVVKIEQQIGTLEGFRNQVEQASKRRATDGNFVNQRNNVHQASKKFQAAYQNNLLDLQLAVQTAKATKAIGELNLSEQTAELNSLLTSLRDSKEKAEGIVGTLRDDATKKTYEKSQSSYSTLSESHSTREWCWFWAAFAGLLCLFGAVSYIIFGTYMAETTANAILTIFRKALLIGAPLLFLRITLTKYNAERFLRILYDHRSAALEQLKLLEAAIDDDLQAKAELRVEAAKMILSDPNTSYGSKSDGSDINISPVFSALEKAAGKQPGN